MVLVYSLVPALKKNILPPFVPRCLSPVKRPLQPRSCWQTVNKADHFAACNFYLFLRTYVSLAAGSLITVRNFAWDTVVTAKLNDSKLGGHVDVPRSATKTLKTFFNLIVPRVSHIKPLLSHKTQSFFRERKKNCLFTITIKRNDFCPPVKDDETQVCREDKKRRQKETAGYKIANVRSSRRVKKVR